jgi:hypothetical protein
VERISAHIFFGGRIEGILELVGGDCSFVWSPEALTALVEIEVKALVT